jgi:release factor glutamine methyltransferase
MAKINAFRLGFSIHPQTKLHFALSDLLTKLPNDLTFSLIISNPPYIKDSQKATVHQVVDTFEPKIALYISDAEYSQWYIRFFKEVFSVLETDGILIMEGHEENLSDLQNLARQQGFKEVELSFDYTSRLRFLTAKK